MARRAVAVAGVLAITGLILLAYVSLRPVREIPPPGEEYVEVSLVGGEWRVEGRHWALRLKDNELDAWSEARVPFSHVYSPGQEGWPSRESSSYYAGTKEGYLDEAKAAMPYLDGAYEILDCLYGTPIILVDGKQEVVYNHDGFGGHAGNPITAGYWLGEVRDVREEGGVVTLDATVAVRNLFTYFHELGHSFAGAGYGYGASFSEAFAMFSEVYAAEKLQELFPADPWLDPVFEGMRYRKELAENCLAEFERQGCPFSRLDLSMVYWAIDESGIAPCGTLVGMFLALEERYPGVFYRWDDLPLPEEYIQIPENERGAAVFIHNLTSTTPEATGYLDKWNIEMPETRLSWEVSGETQSWINAMPGATAKFISGVALTITNTSTVGLTNPRVQRAQLIAEENIYRGTIRYPTEGWPDAIPPGETVTPHITVLGPPDTSIRMLELNLTCDQLLMYDLELPVENIGLVY